MDNLELMDKASQICLSKTLWELSRDILDHFKEESAKHKAKDINLKEIQNFILNFFIAIAILEKSVSDEFILNLIKLIDHFKEKNVKVKLNDDLIVYATSLGKFGQKIEKRKFSAFFCTCLIRISKEEISEINKRLQFLFEDCERQLRLENAFQIRYIIQENNENYCKDFLLQHINSFFEDDLFLKSTLINSLLFMNNIAKFRNDKTLIENLKNIINKIIEINDFCILQHDFEYISEIFTNMVMSAAENDENWTLFIDLIIKFIVKFFFENEIKLSENVSLTLTSDYVLNNIETIVKVLNKKGDKNFMKDFILIAISRFYLKDTNIELLYKKLPLMIHEINSDIFTKNLIARIFFFFIDEENIQNFNFSQELNQINSFFKNTDFKEEWLTYFDDITREMFFKSNGDFIHFILTNLSKIIQIVNKLTNWRIKVTVIKAFQFFPKYLLFNYLKIPKYEEYFKLLTNFCQDHLIKDDSYQIEREVISLLVNIIQFNKNREDILLFINNNIINHQSYFKRRFTKFFIIDYFKTFSLSFIKSKNLLQTFTQFIKCEKVNLLLLQVIQILIDKNIYDDTLITTIKQLSTGQKDETLNNLISHYISQKPKAQNKEEEKSKIEIEDKIAVIEKAIAECEKKEDVLIKKTKVIKKSSNRIGVTIAAKKEVGKRKVSMQNSNTLSDKNQPVIPNKNRNSINGPKNSNNKNTKRKSN